MPQNQSPTKEEIQARIKFFMDSAIKSFSQKEDIDDLENQLYFRELIIKAHAKKFHCFPRACESNAKTFLYKSDRDLFEGLKGSSQLRIISALIAADILGIEFKPPQEITNLGSIHYEQILTGNKNIDEKYTQIIIEYFHKRAKKNLKKRLYYTSPEEIENQKYFRELIIKAFLQKYNSLPIGFHKRRDYQAVEFGSPTIKSLGLEVTIGEGLIIIKPLSALIAARYLKIKFDPPHEISDINTDKEVCKLYSDHGFKEEYIEYVLNYFNRLASQHHETYGTPRFPNTEKYFRELIIKAFIKKFDMIPKHHLSAKYAKPFGYGNIGSLCSSIVNNCNREISLKTASKAAEILGVKLKIPDKNYHVSRRVIFLGENQEFLDLAIREFNLRALANYEKYGRPDDYKNQDYYRDLVIRAFVKLHNAIPSHGSKEKHVAHFSLFKPKAFYTKIVSENSRIEADMALKAADILGIKFKPPQYKYFEDEISEMRSRLRLNEEFLLQC